MKKLLDVPSAAKQLSISPELLRRELKKGRLVCVRIGDRVLFRPVDLDEYIEERLSSRQEHHASNGSTD